MSNCIRCTRHIEDETLAHVYYNPEHPAIDIGPYCLECLADIRMCTGCHYPFVDGEGIKYFGDCQHFCDACAQNIEACDCCSRIRSIHKEYQGKRWCEECFKQNYGHCDRCDTTQDKGEFVYTNLFKAQNALMFEDYPNICSACTATIQDSYLQVELLECQNCAQFYGATGNAHPTYCPRCVSDLPRCNCCNEPSHRTQGRQVRDADGESHYVSVCGDCLHKYKQCTVCSTHTLHTKKIHGKLGTQHVCMHCISDETSECKTCLKFKMVDDEGNCATCRRYYHTNICSCGSVKDHDCICRACGERNTTVYNYSFKPSLYFHYTPRDVKKQEFIFMGIENEITTNGSTSKRNALKRIYGEYGADLLTCKSDASISGYGFEVVTQPMTLSYFNKLGLSKMFARSMKVDRSCGMHVHVSRSSFTNDLHIYKVTNFIHNNKEFINLVSGRDYNHYNKELRDKVSTSVLNAKKYSKAERHVRVNLRNENTIEFRMFAGCTKEFEMRYRLEFLHALVKWTRTVALTNSDVDEFISYVEKRPAEYENLIKFLNKNWR